MTTEDTSARDDERAIEQALIRFARGMDEHDSAALAAILGADAVGAGQWRLVERIKRNRGPSDRSKCSAREQEKSGHVADECSVFRDGSALTAPSGDPCRSIRFRVGRARSAIYSRREAAVQRRCSAMVC